MKKAFSVCLLLLAAVVCTAQDRRPLSIDDYFALKDASDARISPDGKWVVYVVTGAEEKKDESVSDLFMTPFAGGETVQLTYDGKAGHPRWSPDNKQLAFLSTRDKKAQVYLLNRMGGEPARVTEIPQGVEDFAWSPDGKRLLLVLTDPDPDEQKEGDAKAPAPYVITRLFFKFDEVGYVKELYRHIYIYDLAARTLKQVTSGPYDDTSQRQSDDSYPYTPQWSPDGKQILFVSNRTKDPDSNTNTDLFVVSAEGGEPRKLTTHEGPDMTPAWSPNGKTIVYQTSLEPQYLYFDQLTLAEIPAAGGQPKLLTDQLDRNCSRPRFGPDGRIYFLLEDGGTQRLVSIPASGGSLREEAQEKTIYDFDLGPGGEVVFSALRPDVPTEAFAGSGGKSRQLSHINDAALKQVELGRMERYNFVSKDGARIDEFVVKPPAFDPAKKYPAILWIHGGPDLQETGEFYFRPQFLASRGYVVILVNYRGSTGYGKKFQRAIFRDWGGKEVEDLIAGLDYVISKGYIDPDRLAVGGHSYGAILTNYIITTTGRFKAAISNAGESNYFMDYGVDQYLLDWETEVGKPWENPARYVEMSPYFRLKNVKTPTLVLCGQEDWNVPLVNSEQLYQTLRRLGVETMLVVYPGESHEFGRPSYVKDLNLRYAAWFDHYLKGAQSRTP